MNYVLPTVLFTFSAIGFATAQCAIKPIKPIPPLGCKDLTPQCVSDNNGRSYWTWICVPHIGVTDTNKGRPLPPSEPFIPSEIKENAVHPTADSSVDTSPEKTVATQATSEAPKEAWAKSEMDEMRSIVQTINKCKPDIISTKVGKHGKVTVTTTTGIPFNVTWDVGPSSSMRAPYSGYIEVVIGHHMDIDSNKVEYLEMQNDVNTHPALVNRYEFDLAPEGLQFQRKLKRSENEKGWVDDQERGWCWDNAVISAVAAK